jgi:hypothetical protein
MRHVRAKFRCLSITEKWDGHFIAELGAVMQRGENSEENKTFWKYTPAGKAELIYNREHDLTIGAYYYIDMTPSKEGEWYLSSLTRHGHNGQVDGGVVNLSHHRDYDYRKVPQGMLRGSVEMSLSDEAKGALEAFGEAGSTWKVQFTFAEPSDD